MTAALKSPEGWSIVVPVKRLTIAKSRLRTAVPADQHAALVVAMAADTVAAAIATPGVRLVVVVTNEPRAAAALRRLGAVVVADQPGAGLNQALAFGAGRALTVQPGCGVAAISADLPALRSAELAAALAAAAAYPRALVPDVAGDGTTLLTAAVGTALRPRYGERSRARHLATGAVDLLTGPFAGDSAALATLRRDVDTPADLIAARALGLGRHVAAVLGALAS